jgi:tRNA pseudouridine65 synthase
LHHPIAPPGPLPIVASGDGWVVAAKPHALLTHRTPLAPHERDAALQRLRDQLGVHVYPIHRLDRAASGCLLFATRRERAAELQAAMSQPSTQKTYLALVRGCVVVGKRVTIDRPLSGKDACTTAEVLGSCHEPRCSLLRCRIFTGRYHQVRRHLAGISHPILMDSSHGDTKVNRNWRPRGLTRLALHAWRLRVYISDDEIIDATCPLPPALTTVLNDLPFWPDVQETLQHVAPLERIEAQPATIDYQRSTRSLN